MTAHRGVRYREDMGFELRCEDCAYRRQFASFWPLTLEYWAPERGMSRCRACWADRLQGRRSLSVGELEARNEAIRAEKARKQAVRDRSRRRRAGIGRAA